MISGTFHGFRRSICLLALFSFLEVLTILDDSFPCVSSSSRPTPRTRSNDEYTVVTTYGLHLITVRPYLEHQCPRSRRPTASCTKQLKCNCSYWAASKYRQTRNMVVHCGGLRVQPPHRNRQLGVRSNDFQNKPD
ncbi:hypothetical protein FA13DRAFT_111638 [Coprinellus micaceus]|uniref:Secreted protein n=1 Tax=Coprinellus micaceus TaxID=71717 RepID=A0A4Y7THU9_COPMI|nr:hypothetical protein FA13DRAFT_111638 [Coprinellus micaceus]